MSQEKNTKYCRDCGAEIMENAEICPKCGCRQISVSQANAMRTDASSKDRLMALLLCFFFGCIGVHRFYVCKTGTAILQILTLGGCGIWTIIDLIMIATGNFTDKEGKYLLSWGK